MTAYDALAELAERELELVHSGAIDGLKQIHEQRSAVMASLPDMPPPDARQALARAAYLQARVTQILDARMREAGGELRRVNRGRAAMAGYASQGIHPKLVDRAG